MLVLASLQTASAAPLGCAFAVDDAALDAILDRAEGAIAALDPGGLSAGVRDATAAVRCLGAPPDPALLARFFRAMGVAAFAAQDDGRARAAFAAARAAEPELGLDPVLQGPVAELFAASDLDGSTVSMPAPPTGEIYVDAEPTADVPVRRTSIVQLVVDGGVREAWILEPGDPLPVPTVAVAPAPVPAPVPVPARRPSRALLASGLAAGVAGGLAAGGAALAERSYLRSDLPPDEVRGTLAVNRALSYASYGLFAGAGGLGIAAVVVGRW